MSESVHVDQLVLDERCQARVELNPEAVDEYAEAIEAGVELPPVTVVKLNDDLVLIDGFHRLAGTRQAGRSFIRMDIVATTDDLAEALWRASAVNQGHGVRRTSKDKRQAVILALRSEIGEEQPSRAIAEHVGVSKSTVNNIRAELEAGQNGQSEEPEEEPVEEELDEELEAEPTDDRPSEDMYHTAAKRIKGCYRKVCKILGESDDVCEALFVALEKAQNREA